MTHSSLGLVAAAAAVLLGSTTAFAGGFALREQSVVGQGSAFAGVAAGSGGVSSQFWNPAATSVLNEYGLISESNLSLILPQSEATAQNNSKSGNMGDWAVVPASAYSWGVNDKLTLGLTFGAPFGLSTDGSNSWLGALYGDSSEVETYTLGPSASYKLNDWIAVGLGAQLEYMTLNLDSRIPGGPEFLDVEADGLGAGFTAGVMLTPTDTTTIGLGFRSSVHHKLKGNGFGGGPSPVAFLGDITGNFDTPEIVTLGIRQQVTDQFVLLAGAEWSNWSRFDELRIKTANGDLANTENWTDGWYASLGGEYAYSDTLILRAGAAFEKSPVTDTFRTPRIPDNDRLWLSAGASYKINDTFTAHFAYSHVFMKDGDVNIPAGPGPAPGLTASFDQHIDIVSVGLTSDW